jgi:hypothetical protein
MASLVLRRVPRLLRVVHSMLYCSNIAFKFPLRSHTMSTKTKMIIVVVTGLRIDRHEKGWEGGLVGTDEGHM